MKLIKNKNMKINGCYRITKYDLNYDVSIEMFTDKLIKFKMKNFHLEQTETQMEKKTRRQSDHWCIVIQKSQLHVEVGIEEK